MRRRTWAVAQALVLGLIWVWGAARGLSQEASFERAPRPEVSKASIAPGGFAEQALVPELAEVEFVDQFDQRYRIAFPADRPVILAVYQKFSKKQVDGWVDPIASEFGDQVRVLRVADLSDFPAPMTDLIQKVFLKDGRPATLMDTSGLVGKLVPESKPDKMGLLVLGPTGAIFFRGYGAAKPEKLQEASARIREALGEGPAIVSVPMPPLPMTLSPVTPTAPPPVPALDPAMQPRPAPPASVGASAPPPAPAPTETVAMVPVTPASPPPVSPSASMPPAPASVPAPAPAPPLPSVNSAALASLKMTDQFDGQHSVAFPADRPLVMTVSGKNSQDQIMGWMEPLQKDFSGRVRVLNVADLSSLPGFLRDTMKGRFRKDLEHPVVMDFSGDVVRLLPSDPNKMTITVLGRNGEVIYAGAGHASEAALGALSKSLEEALGGSAGQ